MSPQDLIATLDYLEKEKGIDKEYLISAIEDALVAASKKAVGPARELRCSINPKSGEIKAYAKLIVVEKVENKHDEISLNRAREINPYAEVGQEIEEEVDPERFGRIASQYAKQAISTAIKRAEKMIIYTQFKDRVGEIVSGQVRRFERSDVVIDLGKFEAILSKRERVHNEDYSVGETVRCFVKAVENHPNHGPEIILSRADPNFVIKLFQVEVSEISDGTIEIKNIAREPGYRTKIAVHSNDEKVDPVGACVGLRGQRVKNIVRELNNEKVDIIRWDPDIKKFLANALHPAIIHNFRADQDSNRIQIEVDDEQFSLAIGRHGQNIRLTSKLTKWNVDVQPVQSSNPQFGEQVQEAIDDLSKIPGITTEIAQLLVTSGFNTYSALAEFPEAELKSTLEEIEPLQSYADTIIQAVQNETERRKLLDS